jgi:hypothetical protein
MLSGMVQLEKWQDRAAYPTRFDVGRGGGFPGLDVTHFGAAERDPSTMMPDPNQERVVEEIAGVEVGLVRFWRGAFLLAQGSLPSWNSLMRKRPSGFD